MTTAAGVETGIVAVIWVYVGCCKFNRTGMLVSNVKRSPDVQLHFGAKKTGCVPGGECVAAMGGAAHPRISEIWPQ